MMNDLTRPMVVTWKAFEEKPKTFNKSAKLFLCALGVFALLYHIESRFHEYRAQAIVEQAYALKQAINQNLGYSSSSAVSDTGVLEQLKALGHNQERMAGIVGNEDFGDVWVVSAESGKKSYAVFFLKNSGSRFAQHLSALTQGASATKLGGHCNSTEFASDGRLSFCLEL